MTGYCGTFGAEVMKTGKPLAVFIREEDLHFIPEGMARDLKDAVINIDKSNVHEKLEECIANQNILYEESSLGYEYVMKWHNPLYVANVVKKHYEENLNR